MQDKKEQIIPECIYDEDKFVKKVRYYANKIADNQLEIGKLVYFYIAAHGNRYGDNVFGYIAGKTGMEERTLRNYHNLYRLDLRYDSETFQNLKFGVKYKIARLYDHPLADKLIPLYLRRADEMKLTRPQVAAEVSKILSVDELQAKGPAVKPKKPAKSKKLLPQDPSPDENAINEIMQSLNIYTTEHDEALKKALDAVRLLNNRSIKFADGVRGNFNITLDGLLDEILAYIEEQAKNADEFDVAFLENMVQNIIRTAQRLNPIIKKGEWKKVL